MNLNLAFFTLLILFSIDPSAYSSCEFRPSFQTFAAITPKQTRSAKLAHEAITTDLYHGRVVEGRLFSETNGHNAIYIVKVFNPKTGRYRDALFKPRRHGDGGGWNRVPMEYFAYELGLKIGVDRVPPVAYRKKENGNSITINGHTFSEGALLYLVPSAKSLHEVAPNRWRGDSEMTNLSKDLFLSDTRILDVLLQNPDRHMKNFMRGKHWVDGKTLPFLIDHGASLRIDTNLKLSSNGPYGVQGTTKFRKSTIQHLQSLGFQKLIEHNEFISKQEALEIMLRRNEIIQEVKTMIATHGESNVIFDIEPIYFR